MVAASVTASQDAVPPKDSSASLQEEYNSLKRSLSRIPRQPSGLHDGPTTRLNGHKDTPPSDSFHIDIPQMPGAAEIALAALQYLPTPLLVLSSLKTIILANEAMGRLLGLGERPDDLDKSSDTTTDLLKGQTLSQIGVDMLSDGAPVWVSWEKFLDNLTSGLIKDDEMTDSPPDIQRGGSTPLAAPQSLSPTPTRERQWRGRSPCRDKTTIHDTVVDVSVGSQSALISQKRQHNRDAPKSSSAQVACRMIISIWNIEGQRFFTMTFTSPAAQHHHHHNSHSHVVPRAKSSTSTTSNRSTNSHTPTSSTSSSTLQSPSPSESSATTSSFLPMGAPAKCTPPVAFTDFQKVTRMKDAMLRATEIPVLAMWKDESVVFPNAAARRLLVVNAQATSDECYDFKSRFKPWSADFSRQLEDIDNPIISLCRTQKAFTRWQIGLINETTGARSNFDVSGQPVFDEKNSEFFAGLISFKDVTEWTEKIAMQAAENEQQFQLICDMMPQMIWTTRADGYHDYFSQRWYDYTGLTPQNSLGLGWKLPFHEEDMPETGRKWQHSLATGETYNTEYRCRRYDGEWRWMLGRATPLRDSKTGEILKWFGTCTDIQDIVDARENGKVMRQQLLDVLHHSQMNMWIVDREGRLTFFEGSTFEGLSPEEVREQAEGVKFADMLEKKGDINPQFLADISQSAERILRGETTLELHETETDGRWFRCKLVPLLRKEGREAAGEEDIEGVIGISTEVTNLRRKEQENIKLLANESAAKEASKMKSSFLANMSHEIRTPIHGVLGMSEVLMDTRLSTEQTECAQNIQRSANSLLTVVNDILDFSKIESGRLDIEEVQFSLGIVLKDVAKMLSYAAQRKNLNFSSDLHLGDHDDLVLLGDPGRIRQILTNLLTNSIKFTSEGFVSMTARVISESNETTSVEFGVEDTGIGIEEDVKKRLFKPFSQADSSTARRFGGTGLGLTISKNLVDLMKGTISLQSKLGSGTTATFTIPFRKPEYAGGSHSTPMVEVSSFPDRMPSELSISCDNSSNTGDHQQACKISPPLPSPKSGGSMNVNRASLPPVPSKDETPRPEVDRAGVHILVVEDNVVNQQIAIRFLKSLKFSVSAVWNGKEALEYLLKATSDDTALQWQHPLPSLILMDVQMPVLDGYNATHVLRHHEPFRSLDKICNIPIVAMTASAIQGDREKCERAGMDDYLAKPVKRVVLEAMILKWVRANRKMVIGRGDDGVNGVGTHGKRLSLAPLDGGHEGGAGKPALERSSTEHSSNCPGRDYSTNDWMGSKASPMAVPTIGSLGTLDSTGSVSAKPPLRMGTPPRQSSRDIIAARRSLLKTAIGDGDGEGERAMRRAEAEEKAMSLRDAKLLEATGDERRINAARVSRAVDAQEGFGEMASVGRGKEGYTSSYPGQGASDSVGGVMALTEANIEKFNHVVESGSGGEGSLKGVGVGMRDAVPGLSLNPALIPGPPPDMPEPIAMGTSPRLVPVSKTASYETDNGFGAALSLRLGMGQSANWKRSAMGALTADERRKSDWSNSTAKPRRGSFEGEGPRSPP